MKRYYSVKEAARLLNFSTNTIYSYLETGKLSAKRIGRGRFKIPFDELAPYVNSTSSAQSPFIPNLEGVTADSMNEISDNSSNSIVNVYDFDLFQVFLGLLLFGAGLIVFLNQPESLVDLGYVFSVIIASAVAGLIYLVLGLFTKAGRESNLKTRLYWSVALIGVLYVLYTMLINNHFRSSWALYAGVSLSTLTFIIRGYNRCVEKSGFYKEFIIISLFASFFAGIVILVSPSSFPISDLIPWVTRNRGVFAVAWFASSLIPFAYLLMSKFVFRPALQFFFFIVATLSFVFAIFLTIAANWDGAFFAYGYGIFSLFVAWWVVTNQNIKDHKVNVLLTGFFFSILGAFIGILALYAVFANTLIQTIDATKGNLSDAAWSVNRDLDKIRAMLVTSGTSKRMVELLDNGDAVLDRSRIDGDLKSLYGQTNSFKEIVMLSSSGEVVSVYPENSEQEGRNYSQYSVFQVTRSTLRPFITEAYKSFDDKYHVSYAIPLFENDEFKGVVFAELELQKISILNNLGKLNHSVKAFDANGVVVLSNDTNDIGNQIDAEIFELRDADVVRNKKTLRVYDQAASPQWTFIAEQKISSVSRRLWAVHLLISAVVMLNAALTLSVSIILSRRSKNITAI